MRTRYGAEPHTASKNHLKSLGKGLSVTLLPRFEAKNSLSRLREGTTHHRGDMGGVVACGHVIQGRKELDEKQIWPPPRVSNAPLPHKTPTYACIYIYLIWKM